MKKIRLIPRLDIKGPKLVKGVRLDGLRIIGDPQEFASKYYQEGADELLYVDIVASLYGRNNLIDIVKRTAKEIFIPLTVSGGIRSLKDIDDLLNAGADKISINTQAVSNPEFITEAANIFGSSNIVVAIDYKKWPDDSFKKNIFGTVTKTSMGQPQEWENYYQVYTENGRQQTGLDATEWIKEAIERGAGEIMVTSIDCEGMQNGQEIDFLSRISKDISVPIISGGGVGKLYHVYEAIKKGNLDGINIAALLHYHKSNIKEVKNYLDSKNIQVSKNKGI
tara:strand:- start:2327 stop:3166 length:840 start_codon:yes stop_codon:yes gene_type:complete